MAPAKLYTDSVKLTEEKVIAVEQDAMECALSVEWQQIEPVIHIAAGRLPAIINEAESALLALDTIYQRAGQLVRIIEIDRDTDERGIRRQTGARVIATVREPWLTEQMASAANWTRTALPDGGPKGTVPDSEPEVIDPPSRCARTLLDRGQWSFPVLRGIVGAPTLDRDGRIIQSPGYDRQSGVYLDLACEFPAIPEAPTQEDARTALARLARPLRGFPFVSETAKSVALAALLTAVVRRNLRTVPMFIFDAPTAGTGKSKIAEIVGLLASGQKPAAISQGKTAEEDEKRLATLLFAGDPVILIDNMERPIQGDFLCSMLTQDLVQARILGQSDRRILPSLAVVIGTGNNLEVFGDMCRRVVSCRLDARVEDPESRTFDFDACEEVRVDRAELVVAALTVLRAYHIAGRPTPLPAFGSFEDWDWIRGALVWLGHSDPRDSREAIVSSDPAKEALVAVMDAWEKVLETRAVTVKEIQRIQAASPPAKKKGQSKTEPGRYSRSVRGGGPSELKDVLQELVCQGAWNPKTIGKWLAKHKDRVIGGRRFQQVSQSGSHGAKWRLLTS